MADVTHIEKGLAVIEHFDDPANHGFDVPSMPRVPSDPEAMVLSCGFKPRVAAPEQQSRLAALIASIRALPRRLGSRRLRAANPSRTALTRLRPGQVRVLFAHDSTTVTPD